MFYRLNWCRIQTFATIASCFAFGYVDYGILSECQSFRESQNWLLFVRVFVFCVTFTLMSLFIVFNDDKNKTSTYDCWRIPSFIGAAYGISSLTRIIFVLSGYGFGCSVKWSHYLFLYSEIYEAIIYMVSCVVIPPIQILFYLVLWLISASTITTVFATKL